MGLALGSYADGSTTVADVRCGDAELVSTLARWLEGSGMALLALDAPLGWPAPLGAALAAHEAGQPLPEGRLFNRRTDRLVWEQLGQKPLDVGADRIARTARSALKLLDDLRQALSVPIPLAWSPEFTGIAAIEVYPAATLRAHGLPYRGYKKPEQLSRRAEIFERLSSRLAFEPTANVDQYNSDELDAVVCVLAAQDFLQGAARAPEDPDSAREEGWIWFRSAPASRTGSVRA